MQGGADYSVVLPPHQKVGREINTCLLSGVAVNTRGNRTERSEIRVTVLAPVITESHAAQENSAITYDQDSYVAGREMMVTVTLKDAQGNPVSDQVFALTNDSVQGGPCDGLDRRWKQHLHPYPYRTTGGQRLDERHAATPVLKTPRCNSRTEIARMNQQPTPSANQPR